MRWNSIECIALAVGWTVRGMNPNNNSVSSLTKNFQTGSGADPASYSMDTDLEFGHPCCVCNNEVRYNEGQNTNNLLARL